MPKVKQFELFLRAWWQLSGIRPPSRSRSATGESVATVQFQKVSLKAHRVAELDVAAVKSSCGECTPEERCPREREALDDAWLTKLIVWDDTMQ